MKRADPDGSIPARGCKDSRPVPVHIQAHHEFGVLGGQYYKAFLRSMVMVNGNLLQLDLHIRVTKAT